ncbi:hypothetical protein N7532_010444 [Penicillium argentinense]|uniref:Endoplasmic reticulum lectin n=1 Tax=Penicillium argentinense TaxID=1131581 RepID=A0A9W9EPL0_9EURO|nr:uncharacterized protein N7532_010444 [Penicillium argentinense]KAJ5085673.1 hypothetical protein N7532_010444 [Penicillium argentinense]
MGQPRRHFAPWLTLACAVSTAMAAKKPFSIHDDLLAYPQYRVVFPDEFILNAQAEKLLESQTRTTDDASTHEQKDPQVYMDKTRAEEATGGEKGGKSPTYAYEEMIMDDRRLLCQIPHVSSNDMNTTASNQANEADQQKELARATDRGLELLREMEGKCMYYFSGWWSYSFCYQKQIKQFHALPAGRGIPQYPPMEDPTTQSFILGQFPDNTKDTEKRDQKQKQAGQTDVAELHTKGGSRYLVQHLRGGTTCDLTGRDRRVEVQFHCHPQSTDQIGWIKELTTCSYLMVIYTPRLCDDVAFLPPQQDEVHDIECREILEPEDVPEWKALNEWYQANQLVDAATTHSGEPVQIVGGIEVGARVLVGTEGKVMEKGRVASAGEERVEVVAKRENGEVRRIKQVAKKYDIDGDKIEEMRKKLEDIAEGKDWTLEVVVENNGVIKFQGVVVDDESESDTPAQPQHEDQKPLRAEDTRLTESAGSDQEPDEDSTKSRSADTQESEESEGSEEIFKDEL